MSDTTTDTTNTQTEYAAPTQAEPRNLYDPALYINRELGWIEFNRRVLQQAFDPDLALLERVRFLAIFSNNLDEFFMVRVAGLREQVKAGVSDLPADGLTPAQQLAAIRERILALLHEQRRCFHELLVPKLAAEGIDVLHYEGLSAAERDALRRYFETEVFPVLTPLAVDPGRPFPYISNLSLSLAILMEDSEGTQRFARLKVPNVLNRIVPVHEVLGRYGVAGDGAEPGRLRFLFLEDLINANLDMLFPGLRLIAASAFRITRDTDMDITEEEASDLLETIEEGVRQRRFGQVVRMTIVDNMPDAIRQLLVEHLDLQPDDVYAVRAPLGMNDLFELANVDTSLPSLKLPPFIPQRPASLPVDEDIFAAIRRQDILLHHPYDSFMPVVEFFERAAEDPQVLAIKVTLYRTGQNSPIVRALLHAQEKNKQVAVLVELKARFDEQNNIDWARALEAQGVHVVYGLMGLKTHSKIALVIRKEADGVRRYVHLSTGNYNASTARIYTDLGLLTCREDIAADATELFNRLTGYAYNTHYRKLLVAPEHLRPQIAALIERETAHARAGRPARLIFKMNALVDPAMIRLLYEASMAGVKISLMVRTLCCLRPGIPGLSDNIRVTCMIGRFLEHSRVYYFGNNGSEEIYLGSADLMPRNLDHRVEVVFPVETPALKARIMDEVLGVELADTYKAQMLLPDGTYEPVLPAPGAAPVSAQRWFMEHSRDH